MIGVVVRHDGVTDRKICDSADGCDHLLRIELRWSCVQYQYRVVSYDKSSICDIATVLPSKRLLLAPKNVDAISDLLGF